MSRPQEILFNVMVAFLQLIPQSTLTTVFPVSRDIAKSFSITNPSVLPWLVAAYAACFGTFILIGGRLGDIFGHKTMVLIGYAFLGFWSVVAGLSHYAGYELFFIARAFQGLGASMMVPNGLALLGRTYPPGSKQKVISFTIFGGCAPVGAYLGMLFGALFTKFATWHWSFFTLAIVCGLLAISAYFVLISPPPTPKQLRPVTEKLRDMDWLGSVTGVGGLICVQVALVSAPASGWSTQYIFMLLIIGVLLIAFFIITELKIAEQPLVPFKILKADVAFVLGAVACGWATFGIWTWFLWKYLLGIKQYAPLDAAIHVIPIVPVALLASILTAWMMRALRPAWTLFWALVAFTAGPLLLAIDQNVGSTSYWSWTFCSLLIMPLGMDMSMPAATFIMSNFFPPQQQGIAGSLISTTINYSISLGLGIASTVEVHTNHHGRDPMAGIRGGWFMGVGLGGLGILVCVAFVVKSILHPTPPPPKGPPGPPPGSGAGGPRSEMTAPDSPPPNPTRNSRSNTVSSFATTMVAESIRGPLSPQKGDVELLKSFHFDTSIPQTPITPSVRSPTTQTTTFISPPRTTSLGAQYSPSWPGRPAAASSTNPTNTKSSPGPQSPRKSAHKHTESTTPLRPRANSNLPSPQPTTPAPLPTELQPAYRSRGSWESEDDEHDREPFRAAPTNTTTPTDKHAVYGPTSHHGRDVDGFAFHARPVVPRPMIGKFLSFCLFRFKRD